MYLYGKNEADDLTASEKKALKELVDQLKGEKNEKKSIANDLIMSVREAVKMEQGLISGRETHRKLSRPPPKWSKISIKKLRVEVFHMSQPVFASLLNVKPATIRAWEQGQRTPDGAAARLLEILSKDTDIANELAS